MGLFAVPRASLAKRAGKVVQSRHLAGDRRVEARDVEAREMVGLEHPVDVRPRRVDDAFVGQAEVVQQDDGLVATRIVVRQLHVREHPVGMRLGHEERSSVAGGMFGEAMPVDDAHAVVHWIDTERGPCEIEEAHRRNDVGHHARVATQLVDGGLQDERRSRHCIEHLAVGRRLVHESLDDRAIDLVEGGE